ncbi:MAG: signal peptidase I [Acidimicrobiales bacterium]
MTVVHPAPPPSGDGDDPLGAQDDEGAQARRRGPGPGRSPESQEPKSPGRRLLEWVVIIAVAAAAAFGIQAYLIQAFFIPSGSMIPTLKIGDRILVDKLSYDIHSIHRGDIVVFAKPPTDQGDPKIHDLVKRVVGIPGDTISSAPDPACHSDPLCSGHVLVNDKPLPEPYLSTYHQAGPGAGPPIRTQVIPPGHYFMMGDNRNDSKDSRYFGPVSGTLAVGRVVLRVWPLGSVRVF